MFAIILYNTTGQRLGREKQQKYRVITWSLLRSHCWWKSKRISQRPSTHRSYITDSEQTQPEHHSAPWRIPRMHKHPMWRWIGWCSSWVRLNRSHKSTLTWNMTKAKTKLSRTLRILTGSTVLRKFPFCHLSSVSHATLQRICQLCCQHVIYWRSSVKRW